jgi:hypothetical protein
MHLLVVRYLQVALLLLLLRWAQGCFHAQQQAQVHQS